jgi:acyl-CoA ligase (AMP-forming) (exosortase A-associated)
MTLLHHLLQRTADSAPESPALHKAERSYHYAEVATNVARAASGFIALGAQRRDRIAVYLPKQYETVAAMFGASAAGAVFVPVNPVLKPQQVGHILRDSAAVALVTSASRAESLAAELAACPSLRHVVLVDDAPAGFEAGHVQAVAWSALLDLGSAPGYRVIDTDIASILYTSGSTGKPKGVVLSHRNMVAGAESVAQYLENRPSDRLLAALPFSFDYGFSQLSTSFLRGGSVALMDYLVPRDIVRAVDRHAVTGLAAVPPLWIQLAELEWPAAAVERLRYITNSGGAMPQTVLAKLRARLPRTSVFLMYGLTEAFRSTFLPPSQVDTRPTSIGKAIPNAEILVVRPDGTECAANEPGELVHRGALVSLGYWNDPARTAERFKPLTAGNGEVPIAEMAVWSGDTVVRDDEGYLFFVGRRDEMIKTSGYRVSPNEVEEAIYGAGLVTEAVAVGVPHPVLGQTIAVVVVCADSGVTPTAELLTACQAALPAYMVPTHVEWRESLPRNANGKIDRRALADACAARFGIRS